MQDKVLEFIERRFGQYVNDKQSHWQTGNCYYFAVILKERFSSGKIMYDPVDNHFLFRYRGKIYDSKGLDTEKRDLIAWDNYKDFDYLDYNRIVKYCLK